eukprot:12931960-Alexandrium_andersonii.AAC.1
MAKPPQPLMLESALHCFSIITSLCNSSAALFNVPLRVDRLNLAGACHCKASDGQYSEATTKHARRITHKKGHCNNDA